MKAKLEIMRDALANLQPYDHEEIYGILLNLLETLIANPSNQRSRDE